jgi:uncharacterized membrane protein (UPF0127 family)
MESISRYLNDHNIKASLEVTIASTPEDRMRGLQGVDFMDVNHGMLFVFPTLVDDSFWGEGLLIPLDIIFISDIGEILDIRQIFPHDRRKVESSVPYRQALEVNQGWCKVNGISVGMRVIVEGTKVKII